MKHSTVFAAGAHRALAIALCAGLAVAQQCANSWETDFSRVGTAGTNQPVVAVCAWDPDGPGPAADHLVVAGSFSMAGDTNASGIAAWDPATDSWSALGSGLGPLVKGLASGSNGDLVAVGTTMPGSGMPALVARWDGAAWQSFAAGLLGHPREVVVLPNGDVVVAGDMMLGGLSVDVARWDGNLWSDLGLQANGNVRALLGLPGGELLASGVGMQAGGVSVGSIARWDGTAWSGFAPGLNGEVTSLALEANGDVVAGGSFTQAGAIAVSRVARWNGSSWSALGSGVLFDVDTIASLSNGLVAVGGMATGSSIEVWNGTSWVTIADRVCAAMAAMSDGSLACGGSMPTIEPHHTVNHVARWSGSQWFALGVSGGGPNGEVRCALARSNGEVVVGGNFDHFGSMAAHYIANWDGQSWQAMGGGFDGVVLGLDEAPNGDLLAVGLFQQAGGAPANGIARWNGASWTAVGLPASPPTAITCVLALPSGEILVGGDFQAVHGVPASCIASWDGTSWNPLGNGVRNAVIPRVSCLTMLPNGDVVAGGTFKFAGGTLVRNVARWDGSTWHAMSGGLSSSAFPLSSSVLELRTLPTGEILASGLFDTPVQNVARWNGLWWATMGGMDGYGWFAPLPDGDAIAAGPFLTAGGVSAPNLARWHGGTNWSSMGPGADMGIADACTSTGGEVFVVGRFETIGGVLAPRIARLRTSCPAAVQPVGAGCASSTGANDYSADSLPWLGSTFRATCGDLPTSIVGVATGWSMVSLPLSGILAIGEPGCNLFVTPALLEFALVSGGSLQTELALPSDPALAGQHVYQQVVPIEVDASWNLVSMTSSNALQLTLGIL